MCDEPTNVSHAAKFGSSRPLVRPASRLSRSTRMKTRDANIIFARIDLSSRRRPRASRVKRDARHLPRERSLHENASSSSSRSITTPTPVDAHTERVPRYRSGASSPPRSGPVTSSRRRTTTPSAARASSPVLARRGCSHAPEERHDAYYTYIERYIIVTKGPFASTAWKSLQNHHRSRDAGDASDAEIRSGRVRVVTSSLVSCDVWKLPRPAPRPARASIDRSSIAPRSRHRHDGATYTRALSERRCPLNSPPPPSSGTSRREMRVGARDAARTCAGSIDAPSVSRDTGTIAYRGVVRRARSVRGRARTYCGDTKCVSCS